MVNRKLVLFVIVLFSISLACSLGGQGEISSISVEISSPTEGAVYTVGQQIYVVSSAIADNGVAKVYLSVNGQVIGTEEPGGLPQAHVTNFSWVPIAEGNVKLTVIATDGTEQSSEPVSINIQIMPGPDGSAGTGEEAGSPTETFTPQPDVPTDTPAPPTNTPPPTPTFTFTPHPPTPTLTPTSQIGIVVSLAPVIVTILPQMEKVSAQVSIPSGEIKSVAVACPAESVVVGGGFSVHPNVIVHNHRKEGNGWIAYGKNHGGSAKTLNVYANCMKFLSGAATSLVTEQISVPANTSSYGVASCPAGTTVVSGGWASNHDGSLVVYNSTISSNGQGWRVYAKNQKNSSQLLNIYATCLSSSSATSTNMVEEVLQIAGGDSGGIFTACPSGWATGGGFAMQVELQIYNTSPKDWQTWAAMPKILLVFPGR